MAFKKIKRKIKLGVNIDHAATLRQVRGGTTSYPNLKSVAKEAVKGGATQITIHLREDRRHIQDFDVKELCADRPAFINLEIAANEEMVRIAKKNRPDWVCFVPEKRAELTTEGGLNVVKIKNQLRKWIDKLQGDGIEISMFIEPQLEQVVASYWVGADAIELHTGKWVLLKGDAKKREWNRLCEAAHLANDLGMRVHAGHGLDFEHCKLIRSMPHLVEVNVGHFLICESLNEGLKVATQKLAKKLQL